MQVYGTKYFHKTVVDNFRLQFSCPSDFRTDEEIWNHYQQHVGMDTDDLNDEMKEYMTPITVKLTA